MQLANAAEGTSVSWMFSNSNVCAALTAATCPLPAAAVCQAGEYKAADGTCKACLPGATSVGGANAVCSCSAAGAGYNKATPYNYVTGCACAANFLKVADAGCQACMSGATSYGGTESTCKCVGTGLDGNAYSATTGCGESVPSSGIACAAANPLSCTGFGLPRILPF
jgi:hypothetical protein